MANIKLLQLYRNANLYEDLSVAKSALEANAQKADGEILIARYQDSSGNPKALVGIYNGMSGQSATITYLEGVNISESSTVSDAVQAAIDAAVATETERAETAESELQSAITSAIEALVYSDTAVGGSFVTSVNEENGIISVTRAAIASSDKTVTVTSDTDGNIDLAVNIDGTTITAGDDGKLSVASSALTQYVGTNAISISEPDTNNDKTVSLVIDESDVSLSQSTSGLKTTLTVDYDSDEHTVNLKGIDGAVISSFDATEFIVDGMIQSAELVHENPNTGATGEFLAITFNTEHGETTTIYIDVAELIDTYTAGNGLALNDHEFSVKIADSDEGYLQVTEAGLKTDGISTAITEAVATETSRAEAAETTLEEAIEAAQAAATTVVTKDENASHLTMASSTDETTGATTYTIGESDIASATTVSNIITSAGLNSDGSLTDVTLPGSSTNLVDAITELESEIQSGEAKLSISNTDGSITVSTTSDGTVISVKFATAAEGNANDMISVDENGIVLSNVFDCGEY